MCVHLLFFTPHHTTPHHTTPHHTTPHHTTPHHTTPYTSPALLMLPHCYGCQVLIASVDLGCSDEILTILAMLSAQNIFHR
jgi:hypothetical protein